MPKNDSIKNYVDLKQASTLAGVNWETLRAQVRAGKVPAERVGNVYLVHKDDIESIDVRQYKKSRKT